MKIRVCTDNSDRIAAVLAGIQYGTDSRIVIPEDVIKSATYVEEKLNIPKRYLVGVSVDVDLYTGIDDRDDKGSISPRFRRSTQYSLEYYPSGWFLTGVRRLVPKPHQYDLRLTSKAKWAITHYNYRFFN